MTKLRKRNNTYFANILDDLILTSVIALIFVLFISLLLSDGGPKNFDIRDRANRPDGDLLKPLLKPRVPGTIGHSEVQIFIVNHMRSIGWSVELDHFEHDSVPMANIIATLSSRSIQNIDLEPDPNNETRKLI